MNIQCFVVNTLKVPVTRAGYKYILGAIEYVVDTHDYKFYSRISEIYKVTPRYLEKALRDAKEQGLAYMDSKTRDEIFGSEHVANTEYIIKAAEYYRRLLQ